MTAFDGFFIPGLDALGVKAWDSLEAGELRVRYPRLTSDQVSALFVRLARQRERVLVQTPVARIVQAIDAASRQLRSRQDHVAHLVAAATGYSVPVVHETLAHMLSDWSAPSLHAMLAAEPGVAEALDHAVAHPVIETKRMAAFGYARAFHIFSGNVPGVAVTSLIRSLIVKSATLCKTASGEPVLPVLFAHALQDVAPDIASCIALSYWPRDAAEPQQAAIDSADIVVAYGGADAVSAIRNAVPPGKRMVLHGPRLSFGIVGGEASPTIARDIAASVAAYDQQGCVSPHLVYVVGDPERARALAHEVARELERIGQQLPRGQITAEEAVAIRNARTKAEFSDSAELLGNEGTGYTVIFEDSPGFTVSCLNRLLYVKPLRDANDVGGHLPSPDLLQSAAVEGFGEKESAELARTLGRSGISRITSFARLPWPPMHWHHDGSAPLGELVWWQDIEG